MINIRDLVAFSMPELYDSNRWRCAPWGLLSEALHSCRDASGKPTPGPALT